MKCPNCGNETYVADIGDEDWDCGKFYCTVEGTCLNCGKSWRWTEIYSLERELDIEPIDPDDHL